MELASLNSKLRGHIVDVTNNHGRDNRFLSPALGTRRDMYVYTPPGYDGQKPYPIMIWLHGLLQGEQSFLKIVSMFDRAMDEGKLTPMIIAAPDGTFSGKIHLTQPGSFYVNSKHGKYEDMVTTDAWDYLNANFAIRPEKEAHVLAGASMGGFSAFNLAIKHRDTFQNAAGILPFLDARYEGSNGKHSGPFDSNSIIRAQLMRPLEVTGRLYGFIPLRSGLIARRVYGSQGLGEAMIAENPTDMLEIYQVKPGELNMFIAYGGKDQFNLKGETESFMYFAGLRDLSATVVVDANGRHSPTEGKKFFGAFCEWLTPLLTPYAPH
jgi:enterochelin esterase-like enzyme